MTICKECRFIRLQMDHEDVAKQYEFAKCGAEIGIKQRDYVMGGIAKRWYCQTLNTGACPRFVPANGGMDTGGDSVYTEEGVGE